MLIFGKNTNFFEAFAFFPHFHTIRPTFGRILFRTFLFMAFSIDRTEAARRLSVSSRTVDRHISAGRIATKRIGKKTFLEEDDVELLRKTHPERGDDTIVILDREPQEAPEIFSRERSLSREKTPDFASLYSDAQKIIAKKDEIIQELSYKLGKSETELKNSIPLIEYKKTTFLLE